MKVWAGDSFMCPGLGCVAEYSATATYLNLQSTEQIKMLRVETLKNASVVKNI